MIGLAGAFSSFVGIPGEGDRLMETAPRLLEDGEMAVEFSMPEEGGFFPIVGAFEGFFYPDHLLVVVSVSAEILFIADISALGSCP